MDEIDKDLKKYIIKLVIENQWKHPHLSELNLQNCHPHLSLQQNFHPLYFDNIRKI